MKFYDVIVMDRQTLESVVVGAMLSDIEANQILRCLQKFNACDCFIEQVKWYKKGENDNG